MKQKMADSDSDLFFSPDHRPHTERSTFTETTKSTEAKTGQRNSMQKVYPFNFLLFNATYKTGGDQRDPTFDFFFSATRLF